MMQSVTFCGADGVNPEAFRVSAGPEFALPRQRNPKYWAQIPKDRTQRDLRSSGQMSSSSFTVDEGKLAGFVGESVLYGCSTTLLLATITLLLSPKRKFEYGHNKTTRLILLIITSMPLILTTHWIIDLSRIWSAFIGRKSAPEGSLFFFFRLSEPRNVAKLAIVMEEGVFMDMILVHKNYITKFLTKLAMFRPIVSIQYGAEVNLLPPSLSTTSLWCWRSGGLLAVQDSDRHLYELDRPVHSHASSKPLIPVAIESALILGQVQRAIHVDYNGNLVRHDHGAHWSQCHSTASAYGIQPSSISPSGRWLVPHGSAHYRRNRFRNTRYTEERELMDERRKSGRCTRVIASTTGLWMRVINEDQASS
ncbi:hypothetical protein PUNSTDRAFT_44627 [Punctularia strigosozonata HHB-11173 SS5]|uniref:uncharacterized protein n=1 Tax=Punctularia strigosozonata (strain HHB-11173) TaxID=741275 RepID=UPI0004416414|nr:uncharacterized protein PUNSTDRAFT_44627 [Punctularia strigosozonata HHB-11173 SS5]EIN09228.1 hypothetical protein PUNSTDRAFT_44627 [Punctularia strigosozonata HHB-11173 SS5]